MYSRTRNFKIEAENIIKKVTLETLKFESNIFNTLFNNNSFYFIIDKIKKIIQKILIKSFTLIDNNFANSN